MVAETFIRFPALDGYDLGGTLYVAPDVVEPSAAVLFSCGGGIPASRYTRFARYLAANGIPVLIFDYRGIGSSRPRGFGASARLRKTGANSIVAAQLRTCDRAIHALN